MATTALTIITDALLELGIYSSAETVATTDQNIGLDVLNRMIDAWAEEKLSVTQLFNITTTASVGQAVVQAEVPAPVVAFPYGPGQGSVIVNAVTTPLSIVSAIEFSVLSTGAGSGTPIIVWPDIGGFPFQNLNLSPTPNASAALTVPALTPVTSFAALATSYSLGTGVFDALVHNLAIALKPYFVTAQIAPEIVVMAQETKNFLRYQNRPSRALLGRDRRVAVPKQTPVPNEAGT